MNAPGSFYRHKLYPLQDEVLTHINAINSPFYLTGGTALSRFYLHHRYSDDLDFFMNHDPGFVREAERFRMTLESRYESNVQTTYNSDSFYRMMIHSEGVSLKIDLVNDVGYHKGSFIKHPLYYKIDNELNILSNKVSALTREAPKDIADIIYLCRRCPFNWMDIIDDAKLKDASVNEVDVATKIDAFNVGRLDEVNWIDRPERLFLQQSLHTIAKDLLLGADNSLFEGPPPGL